MPENERSVRQRVIDVLVAIHVKQARTGAVVNEKRHRFLKDLMELVTPVGIDFRVDS